MAFQNEIDAILDATDIVELVREYVTLEKTGKNYIGLCPFHNEKTPSFSVSPEKKLAHCFSCGKGGNAIQFLMDIKNISFKEALKTLGDRVGIKVSISESDKKESINTKYYDIMETATGFYARTLNATESGKKALDYLHKRGIDDETIKTFEIGLATSNRDVLYKVLKDSNYLELDMIDDGLIKKSDYGYYDMFTRRIMFPIRDAMGHAIAFSGRTYQDVDSSQPKYVNSPETIIFKKGLVLYNLNRATTDILKQKRVILHEGFMDVIASYKSGLKECVCSMGTALTKDQALLLKKYTDNAVICYDGDKAGVKASIKAIQIFKSVNMNVHLVRLPQGMDPDEYVKKYGIDEYVKFFNNNQIDSYEYSFIEATTDKNINDALVVENVKEFMFKILSKSNSLTLVERYLSKLADWIKVSVSSLSVDYSTYCSKSRIEQSVEKRMTEKKVFKYSNDAIPSFLNIKKAELRVFNYAKISKEKAKYIDNVLEGIGFEPKNQELWIKLIDDFYEKNNSFNEELFVKSLEESDYRCYSANINALNNSIKEPYNDADLEKCIAYLKQQGKVNLNNSLDKEIKNTNNLEDQISILKSKFDLIKQTQNKNRK